MSLPNPWRNLNSASGKEYAAKGFRPCFSKSWHFAAVTGSSGGEKGSLTITKQDKSSPGISTPSQRLVVPKGWLSRSFGNSLAASFGFRPKSLAQTR